jgi:hypothetical protein
VSEFLSVLQDELLAADIPIEKVEEYLYEGSLDVLKLMARVYRNDSGKEIGGK